MARQITKEDGLKRFVPIWSIRLRQSMSDIGIVTYAQEKLYIPTNKQKDFSLGCQILMVSHARGAKTE